MTDLDLGMNNWMADPFPYPEKPIDRGKVLSAEDLERLGGFARYKDIDGDGVGYRTLPGTNHPTPHTSHAAAATTKRPSIPSGKTITSTTWIAWRTSSKSCASTFRSRLCIGTNKAKIGFIALGTSDYAVRESCDQLRERERHRRQLPAPQSLSVHAGGEGFHPPSRPRICGGSESRRAVAGADEAGFRPGVLAKLRSLRYYGGLPLDARTVTEEIVRQEGK